MPSLWNLLFKRQPLRHFARLDAQGICLALRQGNAAPAGNGWVEVSESRLHWLNRPLPASARVLRRAARRQVQSALAV